MTDRRENISSGSTFEQAYGYSRAVKVGNTVYIAGTVGFDYQTGEISADPAEQVRQIVSNFERALGQAGARLSEVVQLTTYVTSPDVFETVGPELGRIFSDIRPTNAALVVAFPFPDIQVEISAVAVIGCAG